MEETEEQKKDHERRKRYVSREQLVSVMSKHKVGETKDPAVVAFGFPPIMAGAVLTK